MSIRLSIAASRSSYLYLSTAAGRPSRQSMSPSTNTAVDPGGIGDTVHRKASLV